MPQRGSAPCSSLPVRAIRALAFCFMLTFITSLPVARATPQLVTADGEYRMGDRDTKEEAMRLAVEAAKRHALEQVATYVESVTVAHGLDLTRDEIRSYTAGVVVVTQQSVTTRLEGEAIVFHAEITAQLDPDEVMQAAHALRQNDEARQQVTLLQAEVEQLQQQLGEANQKLAAATTPEQAHFASLEREELLNRVQSDEMLTRAWTSVAYGPAVPWPYVQGLWGQAWMLYPANPHLVVLQRVLPVAAPAATAPRAVASAPAPSFMRASPAPPPRVVPTPPLSTFRGPHRLPTPHGSAPGPPSVSRQPYVPHTVVPHHSAPRMAPRGFSGGGRGGGRR